MPTATYTIADFYLTSSWTSGGTPSTPTAVKSVSIAGIDAGSTINSANVTCTLGSANTGTNINDTCFSTNNSTYSTPSYWDTTGPPAVEAIPVSYIVIGGTLYIRFRFRANGNTGSGSGIMEYKNITVNVTWTPGTSLKIWTGSSWLNGTPHIWTGSSWVKCTAYIWNGSAWKKGT